LRPLARFACLTLVFPRFAAGRGVLRATFFFVLLLRLGGITVIVWDSSSQRDCTCTQFEDSVQSLGILFSTRQARFWVDP